MKSTSLELCAGAGGAALGLQNAGFTPVAMIENDPRCCSTLRQNRPYWNIIEADLKTFDPVYWRGVDLVSGGLPCPPFSIAGRGMGEDDDRDLFPDMLRIVKQLEPRAVLIENVRGLLSNKFEPYRRKINAELNSLGFDPFWSMFNAADFGTPQRRFRVFLIALRRGHTNPLDWPIPVTVKPTSVGEVVGDLMAANGWEKAEQWIRGASDLAPTIVGGSKKHGGPDLGPTRARKQWAEMNVDGIGIANEAPKRGFSGMPRLTPRMIARLQGFPDDWIFSGAKTAQCRQIGNALPVQLATAVSCAVHKCLR